MSKIEEIRIRCEAATPGEWTRKDTRDYAEIHNSDTWGKALSPIAIVARGYYADFITHSREDIPYLLSEVERLTAELEAYKQREEDTRTPMLQYENLRKHFRQLVTDVLGEDYYNEAMDVYKCDELCCRDLKNKMKQKPPKKQRR